MLAPLMLPDFLLRSMVFLLPSRNPLRSISSPLRKLRLLVCLFPRCCLTPQIFSLDAYQLSAFPSPFLPCSFTGKLFLSSLLEFISLRIPWAGVTSLLPSSFRMSAAISSNLRGSSKLSRTSIVCDNKFTPTPQVKEKMNEAILLVPSLIYNNDCSFLKQRSKESSQLSRQLERGFESMRTDGGEGLDKFGEKGLGPHSAV